MFKNQTILITGGTGSFGRYLTSHILSKTQAKKLIIVSRDEWKQWKMAQDFETENGRLEFKIGDVRDLASVDNVMKGVDYVFQAAALKQVPSCEFFPMEAVKTNIIGTDNVVSSAIKNGVKKVICLSTDKAAYPINAMGMSKALMEKAAVARARTVAGDATTICVTRYGNVMGSRGSVIPLFYNLIKEGKPLTITNPNMTRFMMTLEDAVDLVLFAFENGKPGDLFVQKAPAATIQTLVEAICKHKEVPVNTNIIGTRHGEKQAETLVTREEMMRAEDLGNYFRVSMDDRDLNYGKYFEKGQKALEEITEYTSDNTERLDVDGMVKLLIKMGEIEV